MPSPKPSGIPVSGQTGQSRPTSALDDCPKLVPVLVRICARSVAGSGAAASAATSAFPSLSQSPVASAPGAPQTAPAGSVDQPFQPPSGLKPADASNTWICAPPFASV